MSLESLLKLVEKLRERIDTHGPALRGSEALTRSALIDPLLRELGWDTSDPALVIPEYRSGTGRADYALLNNGVPAIMLEAKKLDEPLQDSVLSQGINYCLMEGTGFFCVTDGRRWETYETHRPVPIDQKRIARFDLKEGSAAEVCLKALALWRPSVQAGQVATVQTPVVLQGTESANAPEIQTTPPVAQPAPTIQSTLNRIPQPVRSAVDNQGWQPLSDVTHTRGHPSPAEITFPDDTSVSINNWYDLMTEPVRWLTSNNILTASDCPIQVSNQRSLVATAPTHPTGRPMRTPKEVNSLYVEVHYQASQCVRNAKTIIQRVDQDPTQFKVRFS